MADDQEFQETLAAATIAADAAMDVLVESAVNDMAAQPLQRAKLMFQISHVMSSFGDEEARRTLAIAIADKLPKLTLTAVAGVLHAADIRSRPK